MIKNRDKIDVASDHLEGLFARILGDWGGGVGIEIVEGTRSIDDIYSFHRS